MWGYVYGSLQTQIGATWTTVETLRSMANASSWFGGEWVDKLSEMRKWQAGDSIFLLNAVGWSDVVKDVASRPEQPTPQPEFLSQTYERQAVSHPTQSLQARGRL